MAQRQLSEDDYRATVLDPKLETWGYPYRDLNSCTRGSHNRFRLYDQDREPDYIFWGGTTPILNVEAKSRDAQFPQCLDQAVMHAKNFRNFQENDREVTIPFILVAAGNKIRMYQAMVVGGIHLQFEELDHILTWDQLIAEIRTRESPVPAQITKTTLGHDILISTLQEIYDALASSRPRIASNPDELVIAMNTVLQEAVPAGRDEIAKAVSVLSTRLAGRLLPLLNRYDLSRIKPEDLAYAYRKFVIQFFKGDSHAFNEEDVGRYWTPTEIIDFMVKIADPQPGERIIDPACGSGGFVGLVASKLLSHGEQIVSLQKNLLACDVDPFAVSITQTFLRLLIPSANPAVWQVFRKNSLLSKKVYPWEEADLSKVLKPDSFDVVIGNPPGGDEYIFGKETSIRNALPFDPGGGRMKNGSLFLLRSVQLAKNGGRICTVVPEGVLTNTEHSKLRAFINANCEVKLIVSLPRVFPNVPSKMNILYMIKGRGAKPDDTRFLAKVDLQPTDGQEAPSLESELNRVLEKFRSD